MFQRRKHFLLILEETLSKSKDSFLPREAYNTGNSDQIGEDFLKYFPVTSH